MGVALSGLWTPDKNMLKLLQLCLRNVVPYWYLISRVLEFEIWRDSISRGFTFAISICNYEKRALNFAIHQFSTI